MYGLPISLQLHVSAVFVKRMEFTVRLRQAKRFHDIVAKVVSRCTFPTTLPGCIMSKAIEYFTHHFVFLKQAVFGLWGCVRCPAIYIRTVSGHTTNGKDL